MKITLLLIVLVSTSLMAQNHINYSDLEHKKLPKSVRKFFQNSNKPLDELKPSIPKGSDEIQKSIPDRKFREHSKSYTINKSLDEVWKKYTNISPSQAWQTPSSKFVMAYDMCKNRVYYEDSPDLPQKVEENNMFFLKLTFLGLLNIPVAFEITKVDHEKKIIEFTYLKDNKSNGRQTLYFSEQDGVTTIKHDTIYSSGSDFRDKNLYPYFHTVALDDFHNRMFEIIESGQ